MDITEDPQVTLCRMPTNSDLRIFRVDVMAG